MVLSKKLSAICIGLCLIMGLNGCTGSANTAEILATITNVWNEVLIQNGQSEESATYSFDSNNNIVSIKFKKSLANFADFGNLFSIENATSTQVSDTLVAGTDVTVLEVTGTLQGQQVAIDIVIKLVEGSLQTNGQNITFTYTLEISVPGIGTVSKTKITNTGTLSQDSQAIAFTHSSTLPLDQQPTPDPQETDIEANWTLTN